MRIKTESLSSDASISFYYVMRKGTLSPKTCYLLQTTCTSMQCHSALNFVFCRLKVAGDMITLPNGSVYHRSQLQGILGEIILACADFANHLQRAEFDLHSFACMLIMTVLNGKL